MENLPNIIELLEQTTVTEADIEQAIIDWKEKPPDEIYTNLIEPEIEND